MAMLQGQLSQGSEAWQEQRAALVAEAGELRAEVQKQIALVAQLQEQLLDGGKQRDMQQVQAAEAQVSHAVEVSSCHDTLVCAVQWRPCIINTPLHSPTFCMLIQTTWE